MKKIAFILAAFLVLGSSSFLFAAQNYDIKEMTPEIKQAFAGRQNRYRELQALKSAGSVGEDNQGDVKALKNSPDIADIVSQENNDRLIIYQAIVNQHQLGPSGMTQVRAAFAEIQRSRAKPNDPIQDNSGQWVKK